MKNENETVHPGKTRPDPVITAISLGLILSCIVISATLFGADLKAVGLFFIYQAFFLFFPGRFLSARIMKIDLGGRAANFAFSWLIGFAFLIVIYYITMKTGFRGLLQVVPPVLSLLHIASVVQIYWRHRKNTDSEQKGAVSLPAIRRLWSASPFLGVFSLIYFLSMIYTQFVYPDPEKAAFLQGYQDDVWHMGNINGLARSLPPLDHHVDGVVFTYHYFADLHYAICQNLFSISSDKLIFTCGPYISAVLFSCALYGFFQTFTKNKRRVPIYCVLSVFSAIVSSSITNGTLDTWESGFYIHVFTNTNGVAFAISALMIFCVVVQKTGSDMPLKIKGIISLTILTALVTGFKGPFGPLCVGGLLVYTVVEAIARHRLQWIRLWSAIFSGISFVAVYFFIVIGYHINGRLGMGSTFNAMSLGILASTKRFILSKVVYKLFPETIADNLAMLILMFIAECFFMLAAFSLPWLITAVGRVKQIGRSGTGQNEGICLMMIMTILGFGAFFSLSHPGMSQGYFLLGVVPLVQVVVFRYFEENADREKKWYPWVQRFFILGMICGICLSVLGYGTKIYKDVAHYRQAQVEAAGDIRYQGISAEEFQGLVWIRENTKQDALCATNRRLLYPGKAEMEIRGSRFFYYSAYAERRFFLEGFTYSAVSQELADAKKQINDQIFAPNVTNRAELARARGIEYLLVSKLVDPDLDLTSEGVRLCFSNKDLDVYRVSTR